MNDLVLLSCTGVVCNSELEINNFNWVKLPTSPPNLSGVYIYIYIAMDSSLSYIVF